MAVSLLQLDSGLRVAAESVPHAPSVHLGAWLRCGARCEQPADSGMSHFLEHIVFKGGRRRDAKALSRDLEAIGGQFDAYTTHEATVYTLQVLPDHLPRALDVLAELLIGGPINADEVATEKNVVLEEILEAEDSPGDVAGELCARQAWDGDALGRPVLGTPETVEAFTAERLTEHRRGGYTAERMLLAAAGAITTDDLAGLAAEALAELPHANGDVRPPSPAFTHGLVCRRLPVDQVHLCLGAPAFAVQDPDRYALWLLDALLGATMSSRLFQQVRENRGLAYQITSSWQALSDVGMETIEAVAHPRHIPELLRVTMAEIATLVEDGVPEEDLAWVKEYSRTTAILASEPLGARLGRLARGFFFEDRYIPLEETLAAVEATTAEDLQRAARRVFGEGRYVLSLVGPVTERRAEAWWKVVQG